MSGIINVKEVRSMLYGECNNCGSHVDPLSNRNFCGNCGSPLKWNKNYIQRQNELIEYGFEESLKEEAWYEDWKNN